MSLLLLIILIAKFIYVFQNPSKMKKAQAEIDAVLGQERITFEAIKKLEYATNLTFPQSFLKNDISYANVIYPLSFRYVRLIVVESLRLYPQPPLLIRRSLKSDRLPGIVSDYNNCKI